MSVSVSELKEQGYPGVCWSGFLSPSRGVLPYETDNRGFNLDLTDLLRTEISSRR